jgi:hypothetical protein
MAFTYSKLAEVTVGATAASTIEFNNIPQNYNDLLINFSSRLSSAPFGADQEIWCELGFNGQGMHVNNTGKLLSGLGSSVNSTSNYTFFYIPTSLATASTFANTQIYIPNYAGNTQKSFSIDSVQENNVSTAYVNLSSGLWTGTTAISTFTIYPRAGAFVQHSTATLYGVKAEV